MGRVSRAEDMALGREVALKEIVLPAGVTGSERTRILARVRREARIAAQLNHPGIVRVHDIIEHDDAPLIVMEYLDGRSLGAAIRESGPLHPARVAGIGSAVLSALAHAHSVGVVHRDLKPDNIMLTRDGRTVLTDFGIARRFDDDGTALTAPGTILGTPAFMAPEQIEGRRVTAAADLWSLGATLYLAVEGQLPFDGESMTEMCMAILTRPMRAPRRADRLTPLLNALLTKDPASRATVHTAASYLEAFAEPAPTAPESATEIEPPTLAADDPSAQSGRPPVVTSKPIRPLWRRPLALVLVCTAAAVAITPGLLPSPGKPSSSTGSGRTTENPAAAPTATSTVKAKLTATVTDPVATSDSGGVYSAAFAPDGTTLAVGDANANTYLWDAPSGDLTATLPHPDPHPLSGVFPVAFARNGATLATVDGNTSIYLWNASSKTLTATLHEPDSEGIVAMTFAPSGDLDTADDNGNVYRWDPATGKLTATTKLGTSHNVFTSAVFSQTGTSLATADFIDSDGTIYVWNTTTGKLTVSFTVPKGSGTIPLSFSPDGATLASADDGSTVHLWNTTTGKLTATLTVPNYQGVTALTFAPDGATLAASTSSGNTFLWNASTGKLIAAIADPDEQRVSVTALSRNGTNLAACDGGSGTNTATCYVWRIAEQKP